MAHKVLLADDSVTAQNMGRRILVDAGYEVITVNNGSSALKKITEAKPDLIVLDVYMPGYGGLEVCQRIRETPETARIPVLLTVGKLEPFKGDEARRVRADAFIVKPFEASELLAALTHLEDKIVAQPSAPKRNQPLKADPPPEPASDFGDKDRGWRSRLRIPAVRGRTRDAEPDSDSPPQPSEFYEVKLRGSESAPPPAEIAAVVPTAVEQEALNRTSEPQAGQGPEAEPAVEPQPSQPATGEERTIAKDLGETPARLESEPTLHPEPAVATSIAPVAEDRPQAERRLGEEDVAAALATLAPNSARSAAPGKADARPQAGGSEPAAATMAATGTRLQLATTRWIAEAVALTNDESSLILEHEMQKALAALAAPAAEASVVSPSEIPSLALESSIPQETKLLPPEKPASPDTKETRDEAAVSAFSSPVGEKAASLPESSDPLGKQLQAYAAQASAGEVATSQPSPTTDPPAVVAPSKEDLAVAAVERLLAESVAPPALTAKIVEVAQSSLSKLSQEPGTQSAAEAGAGASADSADAIARIVDGVLSELKPKLIEEIVKKMKKDDK
ncbi:MAG TPA: response regulator [Terriglobales bacterium]|nr:response regulator [Terriglobales bacterium]